MPPPTPTGFHSLLQTGDRIQLFYDDAWWATKLNETLFDNSPFATLAQQLVVTQLPGNELRHVGGARPRF